MTSSSPRTDTGPPAGWNDALEDGLNAFVERTGAVGLGLTVFDAHDVLFETGIGHRDREAGLGVDADTIFGIASITKSFTALSLQVLVAEGALSLDDPVTEHLPFTLWEGRPVPTLRHFLNQTTGLPPTPTMTWLRAASQSGDAVAAAPTLREALTTVGSTEELARRASEVATFDGLVAYLNETVDLLAPPGELFSYSNDGYCLMGGVVERVSGVPFDAFVVERILAPLGMARSTFDLAEVLRDSNHSTLYERDEDGEVRRSPAWQTTGRMLGGGMLKSTLNDLRTWVRLLMAPGATGAGVASRAGSLGLDAGLVDAMSVGATWAGSGSSYGLGLQRKDGYNGLTVIGHGGGLKGVSSQIGWVPELGIGAVVLTNLGGLPSLKIWTMAVNAFAGLPLESSVYEPPAYEGSAAEVTDVLGSYASGEPYGRLRLFLDEAGELRAATGEPAAEVPARLVAPDEVALRYAEFEAPVTLLRRDGRVWAAHQGSRVLRRVE